MSRRQKKERKRALRHRQYQLGKQAGKCGVEIGRVAGMGTGGLDTGTAHCREPAEALVGFERSYGAGASAGYTGEGVELGAERVNLDSRTESRDTGRVAMQGHADPPPALAHHDKADVDKLLALHPREEADHGIFIQVSFGCRWHGQRIFWSFQALPSGTGNTRRADRRAECRDRPG